MPCENEPSSRKPDAQLRGQSGGRPPPKSLLRSEFRKISLEWATRPRVAFSLFQVLNSQCAEDSQHGGGWPRFLTPLASATQRVPHPCVFCKGGPRCSRGRE